jgi:hypothetical protein
VTTIAVAGAAVAGGAVAAVELKDKIGGGGEGEKYTGSFSGTISGTVTGVRNCIYTRTVTGASATIRLREHSSSVVRGEFAYEGSSSITSTTCQFLPEMPQFIGSVDDLTGSPSSFSGRQVYPAPAATGGAGERITGEHVYSFQGSFSGDTITGTFKYEETNQSTIPPVGETQNGVGTFTITFQKQQ